MGKTAKWKYIVTIPDKYWTSSSNLEFVIKENDAKKNKRNK